MRIALVCDRWDARGGGLELWAQAFAAGMRARGHELHVVTFDARSPAEGVVLHRVEPRQGKLARAEAVQATLDRLDVDVAHDTGVGWACDVQHPHAGSKIANRTRDLDSRPTLQRWVRRWGPASRRWLCEARELEQRQYEVGRATVLAPSRKVAEDLRRLYGVAEERIRVTPNGVDIERFSSARVEAQRAEARRRFGFGAETVFLFSATNPVLKGIRPLLRAMARLPGAQLLALGAPQSCGGSAPNVTCAGYLDDPMPAYAAADALVQPTYYDACSLTALEAWACGLPVVTTRWNGASELMRDGREGLLLDDPDDVPALAAAMGRLCDPALRREMACPARALAEQNTFDQHLDRIEAVYRSLPCVA